MESVMRRVREREYLIALPFLVVGAFAACGGQPTIANERGLPVNEPPPPAGTGPVAGMGGMSGAEAMGGSVNRAGTTSTAPIDVVDQIPECPAISCSALGYACGSIRDECGNIKNCADENLTCGALEACTGGFDGQPTVCVTSLGEGCTACAGVPDCSTAAQLTQLSGRVITPGRDDANAPNQVGVPNAFVYILRTTEPADLPAFTSGIPAGGMSCDRCEDQDLGPVLVGALTDATGKFTLEGNIPVGMEFLLVVKVGRFRRAVPFTLPESAACTTTTLPTTLPDNPARLPRSMMDGIAVNIPRIAVTTGSLDAIECVLEKMGLAHGEFGNPGDGTAAPRVHFYQGGFAGTPTGARIDADPPTPHDATIYGDLARLMSYDIVISDCEGQNSDTGGGFGGGNMAFSERDQYGAAVREYVNRGGRFFASHLSYSWLHENGTAAFDAADPVATGLGPAATWDTVSQQDTTGTGMISIGRPQASPRIQAFADWMANEGVVDPAVNTFEITDPRSQNLTIAEGVEEFVYQTDGDMRVQQFSINTPFGAPPDAVCGRVAHSGFHVSVGRDDSGGGMAGGGGMPFPGGGNDNSNAVFPNHCQGDLTDQEKVLLYMLFDLNACVGEVPPPPECTPQTCMSLEVECGFTPDGCGTVLDCGPCPVIPPK
jgi:hypothetical protein